MIFTDLETTGVNPSTHGIASIGAVDDRDPSRQFYREVRVPEEAVIDAEALAVNGFTEEQLKDPAKPTVAEALTEYAIFVNGAKEKVLANQNVNFDASFLRRWARQAGVRLPFGGRMLDLHSAFVTARRSQGRELVLNDRGHSAVSLNELAAELGMPKEPDPHNALTGAQYAAECFVRLTEHRNLLPEFAAYPLPPVETKQSLF